jgi:hypothetical protein
MWQYMQSHADDVLVNSTQDGIRRVKESNYAFLVESIVNEYARYRDCELIQVGDFLDTKSFAFGLPKGSKWREKISNAILMLEETGKIEEIYYKWWRKRDSLDCDQNVKSTQMPARFESQFNVANLSGLFLLLFAGMIVACVFCVIEKATFKAPKVCSMLC